MAKIHWRTGALNELDKLLEPIAAEDTELAVVIAERIDAAISRLEAFPLSAPYFGLGLRRLSVPHLPYSCYYRLMDDVVHIISIKHDRQHAMQ